MKRLICFIVGHEWGWEWIVDDAILEHGPCMRCGKPGTKLYTKAEQLVSLTLGNCAMEQDWVLSGSRYKKLREKLMRQCIKDLGERELD